MTFDTFDSYNTDEAYKDKGTTAKGLVDAYKKDNPNGSADDFYAKLNKTWAQDKDGHVKNAVNEAFKTKEEPKAEAPKVEEMTQTTEALKPEEETNIKDDDKKFLEDTNAIATEQENAELGKIIDYRGKDWDNTVDNMMKQGDAFKKIDDKLIEQLPTFMFKRYQNGEFGDVGSKDAKLRLAYFAMNNVVSKLKKLYNADSIVRGQGPIFNDTESAYDKYQQTNLEQGLQNRWNKYKAETDAAIKLATDRGMKEEDAYDSVKTIARNQRLQTAFNMMNEDQKIYLMNVTKKIGDKIGSFDNKELIDFLTGAAVSGDKLTWQEAAAIAVARFGPDVMKAAKDGKGKISGDEKTAGFGGKSKSSATLEDGTKIAPGATMNDEEYNKLVAAGDKLSQQYYNGEIDEAKFRSEYAKLEKIMSEHGWYSFFKNKGITSADDLIRVNNTNNLVALNEELEELNALAKAGNINAEDYEKKIDNIRDRAKNWGATDKMLKGFDDTKKKTLKKLNKK